VALKEEVDRLAQPPSGFGVFLQANEDDTCDVFTGGRKMRVNVSPNVELSELRPGQEVVLNEALNVVIAQGYETAGEVVMLKEVLSDGKRALVISQADEERVVRLAEPLLHQPVRAGDSLLLESRSGYVYERIPKAEVEELILEEVPDISYHDIGGLSGQIEQIRDAIELPYLHADLFKEHRLKPPKGVLLYGPPGCGKTLIAKAVANSLAKQVAEKTAQDEGAKEGKSFFLNIKGPELLNKYVGETERHIRLVFQRAREKASETQPFMSVLRVMGTETEYGIFVPGQSAANAMVASSQIVNAYQAATASRARRARWDFKEENPLRDVRGFDLTREVADSSQLTDEDLGLADVILTNGGHRRRRLRRALLSAYP
jgi:proteasome-associated ATPase